MNAPFVVGVVLGVVAVVYVLWPLLRRPSR